MLENIIFVTVFGDTNVTNYTCVRCFTDAFGSYLSKKIKDLSICVKYTYLYDLNVEIPFRATIVNMLVCFFSS